jgi:L-iditol 2-dehydrogenase
LPDNLDFDSGALAEPLACCVKAVNEFSTIHVGDVVLVTGPGPIGLLAAQLVKAQGTSVILVGTAADSDRLAMGRDLGIDYTFQAETFDIDSVTSELTSGEGVDVLLECSGVPAALLMGLQCVRKQGQITQIGLFGKPFELDFEQIVYKDIRVAGSFGSSVSSWSRALTLLRQGIVQVAPLISNILPLSEWEQGFRIAHQKEGLKVLLHPAD